MASYPTSPYALPRATRESDRRLAGIGLTCLVHVLLLGCWVMARQPLPAQPDGPRSFMQWIDLPPLPRKTETAPEVIRPLPHHPSVQTAPAAPMTIVTAPAAPAAVAPAVPAAAPAVPAAPPAETILETSRRLAGSVDRTLRAQNQPVIAAPLDSPQMRMQSGMQKAYDLAPPKVWQAPKTEELVNQTGDGARRTRVVGGFITYCITQRAPTTSPDMLASNGRERFTNCPQHEDTAAPQNWRTARD